MLILRYDKKFFDWFEDAWVEGDEQQNEDLTDGFEIVEPREWPEFLKKTGDFTGFWTGDQYLMFPGTADKLDQYLATKSPNYKRKT